MKPKQMRTKKSTRETENFAFYGTKSQKLKNETEKNGKNKKILREIVNFAFYGTKVAVEFDKKREKREKKSKKREKNAKSFLKKCDFFEISKKNTVYSLPGKPVRGEIQN